MTCTRGALALFSFNNIYPHLLQSGILKTFKLQAEMQKNKTKYHYHISDDTEHDTLFI